MKKTRFKDYFKRVLWPTICEKLDDYTADLRKEWEAKGFKFNAFMLDSLTPRLGTGLDLELTVFAHAPFVKYEPRRSVPFVYSEDFLITCAVCIAAGADGIRDLRISRTEMNEDDSSPSEPDDDEILLDDSLVPIFHSKASMESYIGRLLEQHHVEVEPSEVVGNLANAMCIPVNHRRGLTEDNSIFGMTVFCRDSPVLPVRVASDGSGMRGRGFIVVDDAAAYNTGSMNFTIAHEIAHWILHRHHFELAAALGGDRNVYVECSVTAGAKTGFAQRDKRIDILLERQADLFAARLLAPRQKFIGYLRTIIDLLKEDCTRLEIARRALTITSTKFGLSFAAGRIRALECGQYWARGIGLSADGRPVKDYLVTEDMLNDDETCEISLHRFQKLCIEDDELRLAAETRIVVWADSHVVLNKFAYVRWGLDLPELTTYAREHADECFVVFKVEQKKADDYRSGLADWSGVALRGDNTGWKRTVVGRQKDSSRNEVSKLIALAKERSEEIARFSKILKDEKYLRGEKLSRIISAAGFTQGEVRKWTGLRERTLSTMCSKDCGEHVDTLSVVAVCAAIVLPYPVSDELMRNLRCQLEEHMDGYVEYLNILNDPAQMRVHQWNRYLLEQDCLPLTDLLDDDYEALSGKMADNRKALLADARARRKAKDGGGNPEKAPR